MTSFRFRLDKVLEWYREACEIEETRLAACMAALAGVRERIAQLQAERESVEREMIAREAFAARDFVALGLYRLRVAQFAMNLQEEHKLRQSAANDQRDKVQAAHRRLRLVEKLRERRLAEHVYAENRELENLAAEAFLAKWITGEGRRWQLQQR